MGVVRDVTVDNLVTAVGNIDTSTLAQDSTLQDVVTAIGNISGGNDPVTNTTVNTLCKDTTGQSIASAISGLGATLGANKADIDGSNIANPLVFRQNIGAAPTLNATLGSCTSVNANLTFGSLNTLIELNNRVCQVTGVFIVSSLIRAGSNLFDMPIGMRIPTLMLVRSDSGAVYIIGTQINNSSRIINPYSDLPADNYRFSACYVRE